MILVMRFSQTETSAATQVIQTRLSLNVISNRCHSCFIIEGTTGKAAKLIWILDHFIFIFKFLKCFNSYWEKPYSAVARWRRSALQCCFFSWVSKLCLIWQNLIGSHFYATLLDTLIFHRLEHLSKLDDFSFFFLFFFCPSPTFVAQPFAQNSLSI